MNEMDEYLAEEKFDATENGTMMDDETDMNFYADNEQQYFDNDGVVSQRAVHQCNLCNKLFVSVKGLEQHGVLHTDERPYKCHVCDKTFRFKSNMFEHRSLHSGFTPHSCPYCGKTCRLKGNLKKHLATHVSTKEELEDAWAPFSSNINRRTAEIAQNTLIVSGNRDRLTSDYTAVARPRKRKLALGIDASIWTDKIRKGELFPYINVDQKMARVEETIKAAEGSGLMTLDELVELLKPMYFDRFDCPLCKSMFMSRSECTEHLNCEHPRARVDRPLFCEICLKSFADRKSMDQHESYHKRVELMIEHGEIEVDIPDILLPDSIVFTDSEETKCVV
ncbi:hypothetical protein PRIPAC_70156 [Pristionchus pacificus]|uniref:Zinc finger protein n=1 Tax=Pristionchus pacificus TaxID=54126 RepID=A0A2A6D0M4_PRIPA|nr:hypothetical protein PRIPAC_70156 [Pristionchus pacificus]|eukprot:PDM83841.1 zinc finger protein [Pristionchus pacificus]